MKIVDGIALWGDDPDDEKDDGALAQLRNCKKVAVKAAGMADRHQGYVMPIGGVIALDGQVSPGAVGFDIACGNKAVKLNVQANDVQADISKIMDEIWANLSFGIGLSNEVSVDHKLFDSDAWKLRAMSPLKQLARNQLGTIGSGNHFVDVFEDLDGAVWVGVHFGSRGLGHKIATYFLDQIGAKDSDKELKTISTASELGVDYLTCMTIAGEYAYAGRDWVCQHIANKVFKADIVTEVHNHHNFCWAEESDGQKLWVHRKGATPAFPSQISFIGGSMGDNSAIVRGVQNDAEAPFSMYSTVHGAGRVLSRTAAAGKMNYKTRERKGGGLISREMMQKWLTEKGVELRGAGTDESPHCYKRLDQVLAAHAGSVEIINVLRPMGVAMAGLDIFDPYKD